MKMIDVDTIITGLIYNDEHEEFCTEKMTVEDFLDSYTEEGCPHTIEAVPVRKGQWITRWDTEGENEDGYDCSNCAGIAEEMFQFCPNCGAKMEGGR